MRKYLIFPPMYDKQERKKNQIKNSNKYINIDRI